MGTKMVLNYMRDTNRPYANADVSANLKNRVPKAAAVKVLATLAGESGYFLLLHDLSLLEVHAPEELASLDQQIKDTKADLEEQRRLLKQLQTELHNKEALPKTVVLSSEIDRVKSENEITLKALLPFRGDSNGTPVNPLSAEDTKRIDAEFNKWRKEWVDRRKVYKEILGMLSEGGQVSDKATFEEDQGITLDDDDALEVEQGEFCKPTAMPRKTGGTMVLPTKRAVSSGTATAPPSQEEGGKKKKAKKA
ncbi:hypothetical protein I316_01975 [Kwoniella heveanensis BCC8398]|uniref:Homologous-pairing protein 2 winged helix domain-containing protein n=1 Tax=Kwoniella heveanensis BCC8398 TaxID=1296120 RepID=A0A1B9GYL0_9TREE|nr:hypothetical protein I316_01975 [Kwoniella heveanensis BCC8398]